MELPDSIEDAAKALRARKTSCVALAELAFSRIDALQAEKNALLTVTKDAALVRAAQLDHELASGSDRGPLHGIPVAIKDCIDTAGVRTTQGSRYFEKNIPAADAMAVTRLTGAGA